MWQLQGWSQRFALCQPVHPTPAQLQPSLGKWNTGISTRGWHSSPAWQTISSGQQLARSTPRWVARSFAQFVPVCGQTPALGATLLYWDPSSTHVPLQAGSEQGVGKSSEDPEQFFSEELPLSKSFESKSKAEEFSLEASVLQPALQLAWAQLLMPTWPWTTRATCGAAQPGWKTWGTLRGHPWLGVPV